MDQGDQSHLERPALSRGPGGTTVELRGDTPRKTIDVLDAVAVARDKTRMALVNEILGEWADKVEHEATLVQRVLGSNPQRADSRGAGQ